MRSWPPSTPKFTTSMPRGCSGITTIPALYDTGVTAEYGDQLLTLSTCNYHTGDGRFVVVARKQAREGELH